MRVLTAAVLGILTAVAAVCAQQQPTFRGGTSIVPVLATVLDNDGRLVPDLEQTDFTILDNGKPQEVVFFQNDVQPFTVVVTLDFSFSMNNNLKLLKAAAEQFILRMLPEDKGQVGAFSDKIDFSGTFTSDRDDLIAALDDLQFGNPTRLYDAIDLSIDLLDDASGRKVVLVFTDGDDTASRRSFDDVLEKARDKEVMIYAIGLQSEFFNGQRMHAHAPQPRAAQTGRRDRRRLLRAEEDRRTGADVYARRAGAAQPLRARVHARQSRRQGTPAGGPREVRHDRARTAHLYRLPRSTRRHELTTNAKSSRCCPSRISGSRPITRSRICSARCSRSPTTDDFEVELQNGVLQVIFEDPSPAKFVVSPNAPVRQIWLSAMSRSYKLSWSAERSAFELDGESLNALVERLTRSFLDN